MFQESRSWENFREVLSTDVKSPQNSKKKRKKPQTTKEMSSIYRVIRENQHKIQSCSANTMLLTKQHYICSFILILSYKQNLSCGLLGRVWDRTPVCHISVIYLLQNPSICGPDKTILHLSPRSLKG